MNIYTKDRIKLKNGGGSPLRTFKKFNLLLLAIMFLAVLISIFFIHQQQHSATSFSSSSSPLEREELITDQACTGDGCNGWSMNKSRIVRTSNGNIFAAYLAPGSGYSSREFRLMWRTPTGWQQILSGNAGREPINLLLGPNDQLDLITWPDGFPQLIQSKQASGRLTFTTSPIPGDWITDDHPYAVAGISPNGTIYVLRTGRDIPGKYYWSYLTPDNHWHFKMTTMDYRYTYPFILPTDSGDLTVVGTRDVLWSELGYTRPPGSFNYVYNAIKYFHFTNAASQPLSERLVKEEVPTEGYPMVEAIARDVYVDTQGRTHILYTLQGTDSQGQYIGRHAIIQNGTVVSDTALAVHFPDRARIIQDTTGRFYIFTAAGNSLYLYPGSITDIDGTQLDPDIILPLHYSASCDNGNCQSPHIAAPRGGTPLANYVDGVYNSGQGEQWVYFRLRLQTIPSLFPASKANRTSQANLLLLRIASRRRLYFIHRIASQKHTHCSHGSQHRFLSAVV